MAQYASYSGYIGGSGGGGGGITSINGATGPAITVAAGSGISVGTVGNTVTVSNTGSGGTVTSVSVVTANGLSGTVANPTTTPAITLTGTLTGDVTGSLNSNILATVNSNVGSFGSSTSIPNFTVNGKGLITAAGSNVVIAPAGTLTGTTLASNVVNSSLTSLGSTTAQTSLAGGLTVTTNTITGNYTIDSTTSDYIIFCNQSAPITITLPVPTNGRQLVLKGITGNMATNIITIAQHASEMIEGVAASFIFSTNYGSIILTSDGTNWWLI